MDYFIQCHTISLGCGKCILLTFLYKNKLTFLGRVGRKEQNRLEYFASSGCADAFRQRLSFSDFQTCLGRLWL